MASAYPFTDKRPWGEFRQFTPNGETSPTTVKIIFIKKGESLSLQRHELRSEFWHVISGTPEITVGSQKTQAQRGDEFTVMPKVDHRIAAPVDDVEILEIASGTFDENDIIRVEDKYGRVSAAK